MEINFDKHMCRVCLKNIGLTPFFGDEGDEFAAQIISSLFKIEVINHANLPNVVCTMCMDDIKAAVRTKETIINSEIMLNTYLEINKPIVADDDQHFRDNNEDSTSNDFEHLDQIGSRVSRDEIIESIKNLEPPSFIFPDMYECENCEIKLDTYSALIVHTSRIHAKAVYECEQCGKEFKHRSSHGKHSSVHRTTRPYKCKQCYKRFKAPRDIQQHSLTHKTEKIFSCPNCDKTFCHMKGLRQHQLSHKEFTEICEICNKTFKHTTFLKLHLASRHGLPKGREKQLKMYSKIAVQRLQKGPCEFCGKIYSCNALKQHINKAHNSLVQFPKLKHGNVPCSYCDKNFYSKSNLLTHMQTHFNSNTAPLDVKTQELYLKYKCDECDKRFTTSQFLKNHKIIHSGKKEYVCTYCRKEFTFKWYLERHVRLLHDTTNSRNYICDVCGKVSLDRVARRLHMLSHTGETPFPCKFCDLKFVYAKSLRTHVQNKHKSNCNDENGKD